MGQDVKSRQISEGQLEDFNKRLRKETTHLLKLAKNGEFDDSEETIVGLEIEAWLTDKHCAPSGSNERFLQELANPLVVPELSKYNIEFNADPVRVQGNCFSRLERSLNKLLSDAKACAQKSSCNIIHIGTLPTLNESMLNTDCMSSLNRYIVLNERIMGLKQGRPMALDIIGNEYLNLSHQDMMLEAAATSLQIHLKSKHDQIKDLYNISQAISPAMVAIAANAPFLFGHDLWAETRIPLFEQAVDIPGVTLEDGSLQKRVTIGHRYLENCLTELFVENLKNYPVLLPDIDEGAHVEDFAHLRLHNGNIWRWNRPILGIEKSGQPHLRIEHRTPSAGPSVIDMIANMAFYVGLCHGYLNSGRDIKAEVSFPEIRFNFYAAAKKGLYANISLGQKHVGISNLILNDWLPLAGKGLLSLGVDREDVEKYLDNVIKPRVMTKQNGACWQRAWKQKHNSSFAELVQAYQENQDNGKAVHEWEL